jgi:hypothetical protein
MDALELGTSLCTHPHWCSKSKPANRAVGNRTKVPPNPDRVMTVAISSGLRADPRVPLTENTESVAPRRVVVMLVAMVAPAG